MKNANISIIYILFLVAIVVCLGSYIAYKMYKNKHDNFNTLIVPTACNPGYCSGDNLIGVTAIVVDCRDKMEGGTSTVALEICSGARPRVGDTIQVCDLVDSFKVGKVVEGSYDHILDMLKEMKVMTIDNVVLSVPSGNDIVSGTVVLDKPHGNKTSSVTGMGCAQFLSITLPMTMPRPF
jgi:hypothetical protein